MGMYAGYTAAANGAAITSFQLPAILAPYFALEAGWTFMARTTDPLGNQVASATTTEGYVIVFFRLPGETGSLGRMVVAESYNFSAGTVTNPAMMGSWTGSAITGGVFTGPVLLSTLAGATYEDPAGAYLSSTGSTATVVSGIYIGPGVFAYGGAGNSGTTYRGFQRFVTPMTPTASGGPPFCFYFSGNSTGSLTTAPTLGRGWRIPKHPHAGAATAFDWGSSVVPWHYLANTGLDAYAVDTAAYPSSRACLARATVDTRGVRLGEMRSVRFGRGAAAGATHVDSDGANWYYVPGYVPGDASPAAVTVSPFTTWARL